MRNKTMTQLSGIVESEGTRYWFLTEDSRIRVYYDTPEGSEFLGVFRTLMEFQNFIEDIHEL
jgi:hypothetical protein